MTPTNLSGRTRSRLKTAKKYYSGRMMYGVTKGEAGSPSLRGSTKDSARREVNVLKITTGNI